MMINKKKHKHILIYLIVFVFSTYNINAQEIWTLKKCVERAIDKNISIKNSQINLEVAKQEKINAIGRFVPDINASGNYSWNSGLTQNITTGILEEQTTKYATGGINIGMDIYNGLSNIKELQKANLLKLAGRYQLENMIEEISLLIINSYLQILFNKETLNVYNSQLKITGKELIAAQEQFRSGVIPKGDLLIIEANNATAIQNVVIAENNYKLSKISLAQIILIDDLENFDIVDEKYEIPKTDILNKNIKEIIRNAEISKSEIKIAATNLKIAEKEKSIAFTSLHPKINAYYSYNSSVLIGSPISYEEQFDINAGQTYGLQLSIPIFNNLTRKTIIQKNKLNVLKNKNLLNQAKLDLENTINKALNNAKGALKTYEATEQTFKARETAYIYAKERFENGALNTLNFLQVKQNFENTQSDLLKTKYDYIFKLKILEFYSGNSYL